MSEIQLPNAQEIVYCRRCGRRLIGENSKKLGFGPSCFKQWKKENSHQILLFDITRGVTDGGK